MSIAPGPRNCSADFISTFYVQTEENKIVHVITGKEFQKKKIYEINQQLLPGFLLTIFSCGSYRYSLEISKCLGAR